MIPHRQLHQVQLNRPQSQVQKPRNELLKHSASSRLTPTGAACFTVACEDVADEASEKKKRKTGRSHRASSQG